MGGLPRSQSTRALVDRIARGERLAESYAALAGRGEAALDAAGAAIRAGRPEGRDLRDWHSDLIGVYIGVANSDPALVARRIAAADGVSDLLYALGQSSHPAAAGALIGLLDDQRRQVREKAAVALGRREVAAALEPLLELLGRRYLSFAVLEAVAKFDDPRIVEPLEALLARPQPIGVERLAREAIARARGTDN